ncbi:hypothetical protein D0Y65_042910 [Glycine soja]|uniref:Uncharacterized protein n=1 Tax=Glycine soja TaxID=3848 RepID=A0A445GF91_GLYSO|nr:hypothetical protein D0Y65_042910 [Glycine soja]
MILRGSMLSFKISFTSDEILLNFTATLAIPVPVYHQASKNCAQSLNNQVAASICGRYKIPISAFMAHSGSFLAMQTVTAVAGCHQFFDPLTMMFACYFPADCEMLLADIVSHVLTLFMEFMYHLSFGIWGTLVLDKGDNISWD